MAARKTKQAKPKEATGRLLYLPTSAIDLGWRARTDPGDLNPLCASIGERGQIHPIRVTDPDRKGGRYQLVAGFRRLKACERLERMVLCQVVSAEDEYREMQRQIEENTLRQAMDALEEAEALARLKIIYEKLHPETKHGGDPMTKARRVAEAGTPPAPRFTLVAAQSMACSESKVQDLLLMAKMPKRDKDKVAKLSSKPERSKKARELLSKARTERKAANLKEKAQGKSQQTIEDASKPKKPPIHVYHEDCFELMAKLPHESVALVISDPPFDRERNSIAHSTRASVNPEQYSWDKLDLRWVLLAAPLLIPGGQLLAFCPKELVGAYELVCEAAGLDYRLSISWCKTNPGPAHRPTYVSAVEEIIWAVKPGATPYFKPWSEDAQYRPLNWIEGPICQGNERLHPTQKPKWLIHKLLDRHSSAEQRHNVLDPFAGAGTTGVCARERGQAAILVEKTEQYIEWTRDRLKALG